MNKEKKHEVKFKGRAYRTVWNGDDFKVYGMEVDRNLYPDIKRNKYGNVSISGELPDLTLGVEYDIVGIEQETKYGIGYKVINIKREVPTNQTDMYVFLSEILTANQVAELWREYPDIVQRVKENRLDDIDLNKLKGIKEYTFGVIKRKIEENFVLADLVIEFKGYISLAIIKKIYNKYTSIEVLRKKLKQDPYKCLCGLAGVGFQKADSILLEIEKVSNQYLSEGKEPIIEFESSLKESPQRCLACMLYLLEQNEEEGHTKMNLVDLRSQCIKLVPSCIDHFTEVIKDESIYYDKDELEIALMETYQTERYIAETIVKNIENKDTVWNFDIEKYRNVDGFDLSDEQMQIVKNVCNYNICILNGAGGCGKSFSTQAVINMLKDHHKTFRLYSPTGKASKVLSEYTKENAMTIHRGLGYQPINKWYYNQENKILTDIVIVDEFSMVDIKLFKHLLDAIDFNKTKMLLVGDNAQLPSVSCGNLLHDFMSTNLIPTVTLSKVFRYGDGGLMKVATDVRNCEVYLDKNTMSNKATVFGTNKDYTFVDLKAEEITNNCVALYKKLLERGYKIEDIQVLTAKNVGDCGTVQLNNRIQRVANPNYGSSVKMEIGETTYYEGDLVIQKVNNYRAELDYSSLSKEEQMIYGSSSELPSAFVANGETGIIKQIYNTYLLIDFDGIVVKYYKSDMTMVSLGYSISIHKSQGSAQRIIILCTPSTHIFMLSSNLLYVGLTRMKEMCYHLGTLTSVNQAVKKKINLSRNTFMQQLLESAYQSKNKVIENKKVENK